MKDDSYEKIEEHSGHIFRAVLVKVPRFTLLICQKQGRREQRSIKSWIKGQNVTCVIPAHTSDVAMTMLLISDLPEAK